MVTNGTPEPGERLNVTITPLSPGIQRLPRFTLTVSGGSVGREKAAFNAATGDEHLGDVTLSEIVAEHPRPEALGKMRDALKTRLGKGAVVSFQGDQWSMEVSGVAQKTLMAALTHLGHTAHVLENSAAASRSGR